MKKIQIKMTKRFKNFLKKFIKTIRRPEMAVLPGQLAFFFVLSVVPIVTLITYFASYLHVSVSFVSNFLAKAFSTDIANLVRPMIQGQAMSWKFFVTLFIGFFIASNGADSIIVTSNAINGTPNTSYLRRRIKAIIMTMFMVTLFVFILLVPVFGNKIIELFQYVDLNPNITLKIEQVIRFLKGPISWFFMFMFIKIIYTMAPDDKIPSSYTTYGAVFTTILWIIITFIYSFYITHFARYDIFYGSLANLIILMLWVYLLSFVFVVGMCLNQHNNLEKTGKINIQ